MLERSMDVDLKMTEPQLMIYIRSLWLLHSIYRTIREMGLVVTEFPLTHVMVGKVEPNKNLEAYKDATHIDWRTVPNGELYQCMFQTVQNIMCRHENHKDPMGFSYDEAEKTLVMFFAGPKGLVKQLFGATMAKILALEYRLMKHFRMCTKSPLERSRRQNIHYFARTAPPLNSDLTYNEAGEQGILFYSLYFRGIFPKEEFHARHISICFNLRFRVPGHKELFPHPITKGSNYFDRSTLKKPSPDIGHVVIKQEPEDKVVEVITLDDNVNEGVQTTAQSVQVEAQAIDDSKSSTTPAATTTSQVPVTPPSKNESPVKKKLKKTCLNSECRKELKLLNKKIDDGFKQMFDFFEKLPGVISKFSEDIQRTTDQRFQTLQYEMYEFGLRTKQEPSENTLTEEGEFIFIHSYAENSFLKSRTLYNL